MNTLVEASADNNQQDLSTLQSNGFVPLEETAFRHMQKCLVYHRACGEGGVSQLHASSRRPTGKGHLIPPLLPAGTLTKGGMTVSTQNR